MVTIGTWVDTFPAIHDIAQTHDDISCTVGTHPHHADQENEIPIQTLIDYAQRTKVIAIGETGLDYYYDNSPRDIQAESFRRHLRACRETSLPVIVHTRDADEDTLQILREEGLGRGLTGVLHCFSSGRVLAEEAVAGGFYVSLSGLLTFKKSDWLRDIVADLPTDRLLVETDAPYLAPEPYRGKRNEPAYVQHTLATLADVKGLSVDAMADRTTQNFQTLFSKAQVATPARPAESTR
jgi:TatD DNase family protein